jgi:hypothetical protein
MYRDLDIPASKRVHVLTCLHCGHNEYVDA